MPKVRSTSKSTTMAPNPPIAPPSHWIIFDSPLNDSWAERIFSSLDNSLTANSKHHSISIS